MAESSGSGNTFLGFIVGGLVIAVLVVGFFVFTGGNIGGGSDSLNVKIDTPKIETPG